MKQPLLRPRQAAEMLAICERTLWELTTRGDLPCVRFGRSVRYDPGDLSGYVERKKTRRRNEGHRPKDLVAATS